MSERLPFPDYFRGIILFLMIQGHLFRALIDNELKTAAWFRIHEFVHGVVAPGFLFLAGYLFYHTIHKKTLYDLAIKARHLSGIIILGYFLHLPFFSLQKIIKLWGTGIEYKFLNMDILQTIGFSLLIALGVWGLLRKFFIPVTILIIILNLVSPFLNFRPGNIFIASFVDKNISQFPLIYWSVYLFLGILASRYLKKFSPFALLFSVLLLVTSPMFSWKMKTILSGSGKILLLFSLVQLLPQTSSSILKKFLTASRESLFLYLSHLMIVYGSVLNPGLTWFFKDSLSLPFIILLFFVLAGLVYTSAYYLNRFRSKYPDLYNSIKYSLFTFLLIIFLLRRW